MLELVNFQHSYNLFNWLPGGSVDPSAQTGTGTHLNGTCRSVEGCCAPHSVPPPWPSLRISVCVCVCVCVRARSQNLWITDFTSYLTCFRELVRLNTLDNSFKVFIPLVSGDASAWWPSRGSETLTAFTNRSIYPPTSPAKNTWDTRTSLPSLQCIT